MTGDTFIIEELIYFRLRFEFDRQGRATAIVGMYEDGNQDRTKRDKGVSESVNQWRRTY